MTRILVGFMFVAASLSAATLTVVSSASTAAVGQTILVDVNVEGVTDLYAYQFDLIFAPGVLAVSSPSDISDGAFLNSGGFFFPGLIDNAAGAVTFVADTLSGSVAGLSGAGTLARVRLTAAGAGTTMLSIANPILLDSDLEDIAAQLVGSQVKVSAAGDSAVPEPGTSSLLILGGVAVIVWGRRANVSNM